MDDKLKILLCEDDENLGTLLSEYLQAKGFQADLCPDGEVGYKAFLKNKYDICVLDVMMPKKDGFTLAQEIRQANAEIPIIFLTAKQLKEDILEGFKIGADDYITKPFVKEELLARIRANARRQGDVIINTLSFCDLNLDLDTAILSCNTKSIQLSFKEFSILKILLVHPNLVISKEVLIDKVWGNESEAEANNVEAYISFLRKKFQFIGTKVSINTLRRLGYRLEVKND